MTTTRGAEPEDVAGAGEEEPPDTRVSRRRWMRGAAVAGTALAAGAGLAACGTPTPKPAGAAPGTAFGSVPGTAPSTGTSSPAAPGTGTSGASGVQPPPAPPIPPVEVNPSLRVGRTSAIPVGGAVIYPSHGVVVTQPTSGTFKCFSSSCTHLGCTVDKVAAGLILCPCHGARFSIVDGSVKAGPAPRPLPAQDFTIRDGEIVLD
jgi:Rieske Fe-S protein